MDGEGDMIWHSHQEAVGLDVNPMLEAQETPEAFPDLSDSPMLGAILRSPDPPARVVEHRETDFWNSTFAIHDPGNMKNKLLQLLFY